MNLNTMFGLSLRVISVLPGIDNFSENSCLVMTVVFLLKELKHLEFMEFPDFPDINKLFIPENPENPLT